MRLPTIDLNDVVEFPEDDTKPLEEVFNTELDRPVQDKKSRPLWRVVVHKGQTVLFSWHHAIGDGTAAHAFHLAFLDALNHASTSEGAEESAIVQVPTDLALLPAIEHHMDVSITLKTLFGILYSTFTPRSWQSGYKAWTGNPVGSVKHPGVVTRMRALPPPTANALLALCRAHDCTATGFLHTLATRVLSHLLAAPEHKAILKRYKKFVTTVPISLRRFAGLGPLTIVDFVSTYRSSPPITRSAQTWPLTAESFPWSTAAAYTKALRRNMKDVQVIGTIKYIYSLGMAEKYFLDKMGNKRDTTFELSNIGATPKEAIAERKGDDGDGAASKWTMDDMYWGQNDGLFGAVIKMNLSGSPSGSMNVTYTWGVGAIDDAFAESFVEDMHAAIESVLSVPVSQ